ncbi:MAG: RNA polymerase factor sigma-54 [Candidatus Nitrotoga sp.]
MKPSLQLKQSQQLTLTPQLQQSIRLLQLSTLEIHREVMRLLDENPLLERMDEHTTHPGTNNPAVVDNSEQNHRVQDNTLQHTADEWARENNSQNGPLNNLPGNDSKGSDSSRDQAHTENTFGDESTPENSYAAESANADSNSENSPREDWAEPSFSSGNAADDGQESRADIAADTPSLREHLIWQLNMSQLDARDREIVGLLIDALDDNGYLSVSLEEILELLPAQLEITLDDLETALVQLQHLDEPGIAARTLSECLALQIKALPEDTPCRDIALHLVLQHLSLLAAHDFTKLKKTLHCDDATLRAAQALIVQLNPKPGAEFTQRAADYVVPDVVIERHAGSWRARLNREAMPRLRINQMYANILQNRTEQNAQQLAGQLQEARWFIKTLQQRFDTILRVSQAIVERQHHFFEHGEIAMRPLVLREIAEQLELHESTISRVTTQKYMRTPRGIYELKYFFCSGVATEAGGTCSSTAIRALIKQLVDQEDARHPLTDSRMSGILGEQGILVARRTVAKYRDLLNILPVNLRKTL